MGTGALGAAAAVGRGCGFGRWCRYTRTPAVSRRTGVGRRRSHPDHRCAVRASSLGVDRGAGRRNRPADSPFAGPQRRHAFVVDRHRCLRCRSAHHALPHQRRRLRRLRNRGATRRRHGAGAFERRRTPGGTDRAGPCPGAPRARPAGAPAGATARRDWLEAVDHPRRRVGAQPAQLCARRHLQRRVAGLVEGLLQRCGAFRPTAWDA